MTNIKNKLMTFNDRIKDLTVVGQRVEIELRSKDDAFYVGEIVEVGVDYLLLSRETNADTSVMDNNGQTTNVAENKYKIVSIINFSDIRVFSILVEVKDTPIEGESSNVVS